MQINPNVEIKSFIRCAPGELVRHSHSKSRLSLAAKRSDGSFFTIRLQTKEGVNWPVWFLRSPEEAEEEQVLSYGNNYLIQVDHGGDVAFGQLGIPEVPGVLFLHKKELFMRVAPPKDLPDYGWASYNWVSGEIGPSPNAQITASFGRWTLSLPTADPEKWNVVYAFTIDAQHN